MSSPFPMPNYGNPDRRAASSPVLAPKPVPAPPSTEDMSVRQMKLKVLYTFDGENKTNCLARWPHALGIRTAYLDENTQVGVIELKTCLQAIVSASPELVAKLGQDYTVYAYDYSEYETPLVGQGMLSWALASSSSTPTAPAHQSKTMVTGRVCKSILNLFSTVPQETLEVKLRLVPVPTCLQSEYIESMNRYRDISKVMPEGFDAGAWTAFIQANPNILQSTQQSRSQTPLQGAAQKEGVGIEHVQRLLTQGSTSVESNHRQSGSQNVSRSSISAYDQPFRASSPAMSVKSIDGPKRRGRPPKNGSKSAANATRNQRTTSTNQAGIEGGYASSDDRIEEGPLKKRAKVLKADAPSKIALGQQPESLRVAASTAASLRIHQPTAIRPSQNGPQALEPPPRAPTPIGDPTAQIRRPPLLTARSSLRRESLIADDCTYESPYAPSDIGTKPPESALTSPEASRTSSLGDTPADISSSPPVYPAASTAHSSPRLPVFPRDLDASFMSEPMNDLFDDDELRPLDEEDLELAAQYSRRPGLTAASVQIEGESEQPSPDTNISCQTALEEKQIALSRQKARHAVGLGRTVSSGALPRQLAAPAKANRPSNLSRSQSWAGHLKSKASSDAPAEDSSVAPSQSRGRAGSDSGSGAKRKKAIQERLASSIAAGEVPPYCDNCGAIETPTWRKAWVKTHSGTPEYVRISEEEGGILTWQTLKTDDNGIVSLYRIFKKSLLSTDEGFSEILLCNPCGLWLKNRKCLRPEEHWEKSKKNPEGKRRRRNPPKKKTTKSTPCTTGDDPPEASRGQRSDASSPIGDAEYDSQTQMSPQLPITRRPRALSMQISPEQSRKRGMNNVAAAAALHRAIQSSPARLTGTQPTISVAADLTPRSTRRLLFPSPKQSDKLELGQTLGSPIGDKGKAAPSMTPLLPMEGDDDQANKENRPPVNIADEGIDELFDEEPQSISRPTTPTPSTAPQDQTLKTPGNSMGLHRVPPKTGDFFSSTAKALLHHPTTPRRQLGTLNAKPLEEVTPFTAHITQLFSDADGSPSAGFDFPTLPSLHNTPGRFFDNAYDFSHFDSQDFISTDVPMPSSPPAWFGVYEDPIDSGGIFSDYPLPEMPSSPPKVDTTNAKTTRPSKA